MITRVLIRSGGDSDRPLAVFQGVSAVEEGEGDSISMAEAIGEKDRLPGVGNRPVREGEGPERKARRRRREGTGSDAAQWRAGRGVRAGREAYDREIYHSFSVFNRRLSGISPANVTQSACPVVSPLHLYAASALLRAALTPLLRLRTCHPSGNSTIMDPGGPMHIWMHSCATLYGWHCCATWDIRVSAY